MQHPELVAPIAGLIALEVAHLRWIIWTQWHCRRCKETHVDCECKPAWVKLLL